MFSLAAVQKILFYLKAILDVKSYGSILINKWNPQQQEQGMF